MGNSRLDASVSIKFSQKFACQVSWQNIDELAQPLKKTSPMAAPSLAVAAVVAPILPENSKSNPLIPQQAKSGRCFVVGIFPIFTYLSSVN